MGKLISYKGTFGIIGYVNITGDGAEVKGYDLKEITAFRCAMLGTYNGNVETVIKSIISDNTQGTRAFPHFIIAPDQERGESISYTIEKPDTLENIFKAICEKYDLGYDITISGGNMVFDVVTPHTISHTYSQRRRNISGFEYCVDSLTEQNVVTNYGYCEPVDAEVTNGNVNVKKSKVCFPNGEIREVEGEVIIRFDINYVVVRLTPLGKLELSIKSSTNLDDSYVILAKVYGGSNPRISEVYPTSNQYTKYTYESEPTGFARREAAEMLTEDPEAMEKKLSEALDSGKPVENITTDITTYEDYKSKWNLGDYVSVKVYAMGQALTVSMQISEVTEVYEPNNVKVTPTFGRTKDNIFRKLQKGRG